MTTMSNQLAGKKVLFITSNTGIERDELVKPFEALKAQGVLAVSYTHLTLPTTPYV